MGAGRGAGAGRGGQARERGTASRVAVRAQAERSTRGSGLVAPALVGGVEAGGLLLGPPPPRAEPAFQRAHRPDGGDTLRRPGGRSQVREPLPSVRCRALGTPAAAGTRSEGLCSRATSRLTGKASWPQKRGQPGSHEVVRGTRAACSCVACSVPSGLTLRPPFNPVTSQAKPAPPENGPSSHLSCRVPVPSSGTHG